MKKISIFLFIFLLSFFILGSIYYKKDNLKKNRFFYAYFEIKKKSFKTDEPEILTVTVLKKYKITEVEWERFLKKIEKEPDILFHFLKQGG